MNFHFTCLECKNEVDLANFSNQLKKMHENALDEGDEIIIECNHCATDHLVQSVNDEGDVEGEIIERDK